LFRRLMKPWIDMLSLNKVLLASVTVNSSPTGLPRLFGDPMARLRERRINKWLCGFRGLSFVGGSCFLVVEFSSGFATGGVALAWLRAGHVIRIK
jgi:hypothetical protein